MSVLSVRIPDALSERLDALAEATGSNKSFLTEQAVAEYIAREEWIAPTNACYELIV